MTSPPSPQPLKIYLVCYGSENESWVCDAEDRDHAVAQRFKDRLGQRCETQASFDEPAGQAEAFGDAVDIVVEADEILEGAAFLGRRHLELMEVRTAVQN